MTGDLMGDSPVTTGVFTTNPRTGWIGWWELDACGVLHIPSGYVKQKAIENGPVEIVDSPIEKWWFSIVMWQFTRG